MPNTGHPQGRQAFAALIREAREQLTWSQRTLAGEAGVSLRLIARWEAGDATAPMPEQVRKVCGKLGVNPRDALIALGYLTPADLAEVA